MNNLSKRKNREKEFHNERFSEETRNAQHKYYFALSDCYQQYESKLSGLVQDKVVLEYGCSFGANSINLATIAERIVGIDLSDVAIERAQKNQDLAKKNNVEFLVMDAENMSFPEDSFDCVFGSGIIHHLDLHRCYSEISRVLKKEGEAIFIEPLGTNWIINAYRKATPKSRTVDEHPLNRKDIEIAKKYFDQITCTHFGLLTLLTVPFRKMKFGGKGYSIASAIDRKLFKISWLRWQAWFVIIEMRK